MPRKSRYPAKRGEIIEAITALTLEYHRTPSVRELSERIDVPVATLHSYLERLSNEGLIRWEAKRHRSLKLTPEGERIASTQAPF